jgi:hypothetical protein
VYFDPVVSAVAQQVGRQQLVQVLRRLLDRQRRQCRGCPCVDPSAGMKAQDAQHRACRLVESLVRQVERELDPLLDPQYPSALDQPVDLVGESPVRAVPRA